MNKKDIEVKSHHSYAILENQYYGVMPMDGGVGIVWIIMETLNLYIRPKAQRESWCDHGYSLQGFSCRYIEAWSIHVCMSDRSR